MSLNATPPIALWMAVTDDCPIAAEFTGDGDVQITLGGGRESRTVVYEPDAFRRFLSLGREMLALPVPSDPKVTRPRLESLPDDY